MAINFISCIGMIKFVKKIFNCDHNVNINTNIYKKNINNYDNDLSIEDDLYLIKANSKNRINFNHIMRLFNHMTEQFDNLSENTDSDDSDNILDFPYEKLSNHNYFIHVSKIKYNKHDKTYHVILEQDTNNDFFFFPGLYCWTETLEFIKKIIGLKQNITFYSNIYFHVSKECDVDDKEDYYEIYGNDDKEITFDDILDLYNDLQKQFDTIYKIKSDRYYLFSGYDNFDDYDHDYGDKNNVIYSIWWRSEF